MESKLTVKHFGPIKEVELELRNVNVFIGPQATGKSALAKLFTIFKAPRKFFYKKGIEDASLFNETIQKKEFVEVLKEYNIDSFLYNNTEIKYDSDIHTLCYAKGVLSYEPKLFNKIKNLEKLAANFEGNKVEIIEKFSALTDKFIFFYIRANRILSGDVEQQKLKSISEFDNFDQEKCEDFFEAIKSIETELSTNVAVYIPAERNFINIIKKSALNLQLNQVPIPKHILSFGAEIEKLDVKEIDLSFIQEGLKYRVVDGEDRIYINDTRSIMLTEAASGIQSVVPLLAPVLQRSSIYHRSFVMEEPELNLFPIAQYNLIQFLESNRNDSSDFWEDFGSIHTYTTHSPYILSALNNLLYAHKVIQTLNFNDRKEGNFSTEKQKNHREKVQKIVKAEINPSSFRAYQIKDGFANPIFDVKRGLIEDNYIDNASDKLNEDFESLMELTR